MEATQMLMDEHRVIERVIRVLEAGAVDLGSGGHVPAEFFIQVTDFIKGFADGCHHLKEEDVLFPTMQRFGLPAQGGPVAVMLHEHEQGRAYTRELRAAARRLQAGEPSASEEVTRNAFGYSALLRQHILKEDNMLFPMADQVIPAAQHAQVFDDFVKAEQHIRDEGVYEEYLAQAQALENEIGI